MSQAKDSLAPKQTIISQFFAFCVALLGIVVMFGWHLKSTTLIQIHPSLVPMQFNTALGFLLSSMSLLFTLKNYQYIAAVLGLAVCLLGSLTLFEYYNRVDLGIDQLFMASNITTYTPFPGRMAANTAFCFFISGAILVLINLSVRLNQLSILGAVITGLGLISLLGYLLGIETAYAWGSLSQMAVHTSLGFVLLGVGISAGVNNVSSQSSYALYLRNMLSIGITFFVLVVALWQALENWDERKFNLFLTEQLDSIHDAKEAAFTSHVQAFERMAQRWSFDKRTALGAWQKDADSYILYFQGLTEVIWLDEKFKLRRVASQHENAIQESLHTELIEKSRIILQNSSKAKASLSLQFIQGSYKVLLYMPLYANNKFDGYLIGFINLEGFLNEMAHSSSINNEYQLSIYQDERRLASSVLYSPEPLGHYNVMADFTFMGLKWQTELRSTLLVVEQHKSYFPFLVLLVGCCMSALLILLLNLRYRDQIKSKQLEQEVEARKQVEFELLEKEERLRVTLENMYDAVILISGQGSILSFNKAAERIFGYCSEAVMGKNINILMPEPYHSHHDNYLKNYLRSGDAKIIGIGREVKGLRQNGEIFPMTLAVSDMTVKGERIFSGIVRDISFPRF